MRKILFSSLILFVFIFFITCITTFVAYSNQSFTTSSTKYYFSNADYIWPLPEYFHISSPFGFRISPTTGASSYHSGIDIPAPENTAIFAVSSGTVEFTGFQGANGYTIMIEKGNMIFSYCHVSPNFTVHVGDEIEKNQQISCVGPKYISAIPENPYTDISR